MGLLGCRFDWESASEGRCGAAPATNISSTDFCFSVLPPDGGTLAGTAFTNRGLLFLHRCVFRIVLRIRAGASPGALARAAGCVEGFPWRSARCRRGQRTTSPEVAQHVHCNRILADALHLRVCCATTCKCSVSIWSCTWNLTSGPATVHSWWPGAALRAVFQVKS